MDDRELAQLHARAEAALTRIPGVVGVGYGLKVVDGKTTDQVAFRVYVRAKRPLAEVPADERVPDEFEGVPTDVLRVREVVPLHCEDMRQHSPLIGGISISTFKGTDAAEPNGTLGFFATLDGVDGPKNVVLVTNQHVLDPGSGGVGDAVYLPKFVEQEGQVLIVLNQESRIRVAEITDMGLNGNHAFAYPTEAQLDYHVDCACAKLDISISSWCNTNCGVSYKNEIRILNINGNSSIEDVARVTAADLTPGDYVVVKVGRRTSRTVGRITDVAASGTNGQQRMIEIEATENDCDGILRFAAEGDSGSAVINLQSQLIGLLFGAGLGAETHLAFAAHIHPVLDRLKITAITSAHPPEAPAGKALSDLTGALGDGHDETMALRERFVATPRGAAIYDRFLTHRDEVVELVNRRRPVTVAWHRGLGPTFLGHAVENARHREHRIPGAIDGVDRRALLAGMAEALTAHGSEALVAAIAEHRDEVLDLVDRFDDLYELVGHFAEGPAGG